MFLTRDRFNVDTMVLFFIPVVVLTGIAMVYTPVDAVLLINGLHHPWLDFVFSGITHARRFGQSKYGLGRTFKVLSDLILMWFFKFYFKRPIHFFGPLGILCFFSGSAISLYFLVLKVLGNEIWGRPLLILGVTLVLAGIQFLTFGIIAELIMRVYYESQHKTTYHIREIFQKKALHEEMFV